MGKFVDLTGKKFGRLTVIKRLPNDKWGHSRFLCQCECGNTKETTGDNLIRGICQSCGCIQKEVTPSGSSHCRTQPWLYRSVPEPSDHCSCSLRSQYVYDHWPVLYVQWSVRSSTGRCSEHRKLYGTCWL